MRLKWYFREEPTPYFSERPCLWPKLSWSPPADHSNLEVFLSQTEHQLFQIPDESLTYSNLVKDEWQAIRSLNDARSIVIKKADKGPYIVVWDRGNYLSETEKYFCDETIYKDFTKMRKYSAI